MYQILSDFLVKTSGLSLGKEQGKVLSKSISKNSSVKTLMFLHGWGMNSLVWEPIREALESKYKILWIDLPGHGFNQHIKAESLEQMVSLISEVTPDNTHLMGWSLGGIVAQALAQKIPEKIQSTTLVASTPRFSQELSKGLNINWQHAMSDEVLTSFADNLKQDTEKTLKSFIALQFIGVKDSKKAQNNLINHILYNEKPYLAKSEDNKTTKKWGSVILNEGFDPITFKQTEQSNMPTQEALDVGLSILKHADLRDVKPSCPQHWIFSEYDRLIPKEVINDLISLRPDAEITLLEKAGHAPFITHKEIFLKHMNRFIEAQL